MLAEPSQELAIARGSGDRRLDRAFDFEPDFASKRKDLFERFAPYRVIPDDAALAHLLAPGLELGLDEDYQVRRSGAEIDHGRQNQSQRNETDVDYQQIGPIGQVVRERRPDIGAVEHYNPRVIAQLRCQLAVADVER